MQELTEATGPRSWPRKLAMSMLQIASPYTLKGKRDRAVLALLLCAGWSRRQVSELSFDQLFRPGRDWYAGPTFLETWIREAIDAWADAARLSRGRVFRSMGPNQRVLPRPLRPQDAYAVLELYAYHAGVWLAPYVPTRREMIGAMLDLAELHGDDVLYDLGSGDGRIVIGAAQRSVCQAVGVEINPARLREARARARASGLGGRIKFVQQDLFRADIGNATVITLFLLAPINLKLKSKLLNELQTGARIVSHRFDMGEWKPDRTAVVGGDKVFAWLKR